MTLLIVMVILAVAIGIGLGVLGAVYFRRLPGASGRKDRQLEPGSASPDGTRPLPPGEDAQADASVHAADGLLEPGRAPAKSARREEPAADGFFKRLVAGLSKTQGQLVERFDGVLRGRKEIDDALYEELETILLTADVGIRTSQRLLQTIKARASREELKDPGALRGYLREAIQEILRVGSSALALSGKQPFVILIIGVNGAGKTTTIGKLATRFTRDGKQVMLAAGDTFRAAAIEQLEIWGTRSGATVVSNKEGSDPSAVIFDALQAARARGADVVIADTAGRLHTKVNLMEELKKVTRVIDKAVPGAPHEVLLVLDSTMGQNALVQARVFHEGCKLTGLILTKLDGTAKGGAIIGICDELKLPVKFIGVGEREDDLQPFDPEQFVAALF